MFSIDELKKMAVTPGDLSGTMTYFFQLAEELSKQKIGEIYPQENISENLEIQAVLQSIEHQASKFLNEEVKLTNPMILIIPQQSLYHGFCGLKDKHLPVTFFYFSDIKSGMFAFTEGVKTEFFRFALVPQNEKQKPH